MDTRPEKNEIDEFILFNVREHPNDIAVVTAEKFGITRPGVLKHVRSLAQEGKIKITGKTKGRTYELLPLFQESIELENSVTLEEDSVWRDFAKSLLQGLDKNIFDICEYGFLEILNNAIEHSEGSKIIINIQRYPDLIQILIIDNGVGIFQKIQEQFQLENPLHAILELAKGKLTTDPAHHTGEGIYFSSRMFDEFSIISGSLVFLHLTSQKDYLIEHTSDIRGTTVSMEIGVQTARTTEEIFRQYTIDPEGGAFDRTIVPVFLATIGEDNLISRSQARRLFARFDRFKEIILDFSKIEKIGQAFADEIFRVYASEHPDIAIRTANANSEVSRMIFRAKQYR